MRRLLLALCVALLATPALAEAPAWRIEPAGSQVGFAGSHAGRGFEGRFASLAGEIRFDPDAPEAAAATIRIPLAGATTGDLMRDRTLPQADWFDVARHPEAVFVLGPARRVAGDAADGRYEAEGRLTLRGQSVAVPLAFRLRIADGAARLEGEAVLDRLAFGIGAQSDATAQWVSRDIRIRIALAARRV
jgi:cytochrome b561